MIITKKSLARRTLLRGLGTSIALPFLDAMVPALAAPIDKTLKPPVRLGFVYVPNGIMDLNNEWTPKKKGTDFEFTPIMKALEPFRKRLLILSGLAQLQGRPGSDGAGDHARASATFLTGTRPVKTEGMGIRAGISADQIAARQFGKHTPLASLEVGIEDPSMAGGCDSGYSCAYTNTVSWRTETTPNPMEDNPRRLFERLFGDSDSNDPKERLVRLSERRSILDFVGKSLARLQSNIGESDRHKLEEYTDAIRDLERRIENTKTLSTTHVPIIERPRGVPDYFEEHAKLMVDLQLLAFQTDMTRVSTFMMGREGTWRSYPEIGVPESHHLVTHHQNDLDYISKTIKIDKHHIKIFVYMLEKMGSTIDGEGTLLDHSMILYGSALADGNQHTHHDLPLVLAGGGAGRLRGGRHLSYPRETPMNNLLLTILDTAGVSIDHLGDSTEKLEGLLKV